MSRPPKKKAAPRGKSFTSRRAKLAIRTRWLRVAFERANWPVPDDWLAQAVADGLKPKAVPALVARWRAEEQAEHAARAAQQEAERQAYHERQERERREEQEALAAAASLAQMALAAGLAAAEAAARVEPEVEPDGVVTDTQQPEPGPLWQCQGCLRLFAGRAAAERHGRCGGIEHVAHQWKLYKP